ncbi:trypsin, alkaline C-like [Anticarsia gemmatalis]|uniref:trypsin, alkaline C-like n=1 Tax=Anticarsia gemmatalis TaxID=129554 RepID=UPI003F768D10
MRVCVVLALCFAAVLALPSNRPIVRIVGGSETNIANYPSIVPLLESWGSGVFSHFCGGTIMNQRTILSAAHCFGRNDPRIFRIRAGSSMANSGGTLYNINSVLIHPNYNGVFDIDIALLRTSSLIVYSNVVQRGSIAGPNYPLGDNENVWAAGWGAIASGGPWSNVLRHVQLRTVNHEVCRRSYPGTLTNNMLCAGWVGGGRDSCQGDSGGPLYHNGVVVGVTSFGNGCGLPNVPGVYASVPRVARWIEDNA